MSDRCVCVCVCVCVSTLLTLLCVVWLKRSCAEVKRSTSRILAVIGEDRKTLAVGSLKPTVW